MYIRKLMINGDFKTRRKFAILPYLFYVCYLLLVNIFLERSILVIFLLIEREKIKESVEIPILTRCCFCFPLRRGLIAFAYTNLILTLVVTSFLSLYISVIRNSSQQQQQEMASELIRLIVDTVALLIEVTMTTVFVVALHKKHVLLMKLYLYFEIIYSTIGFAYSLAFINKETASELFLILFQLTLQIYLVILIWSSIVKMERDGSVKYTRESGTA